VTEFGNLKSGPLPPKTSVQLAELVALTKALKLSKEQRVNIYTDSKYAFLILHAHAAIRKKRGMLITTGTTYHRDTREITLIVLGITALIAAHAGISYGVMANHVTSKEPNQSNRGHLRQGRPCHSGHTMVFFIPCLYGNGPPPGPRFSVG
jgi:hypothetical protein